MRLRYRGESREVDEELFSLLLGPPPPDGSRTNGCGAGGALLAWVVPDSWLDVPLWIACAYHDHAYSKAAPLGGTWASRQLADWLLGVNVELLLRAHGLTAVTSRLIGWLYRGRVRLWGAAAFRGWTPGERPESWWQRVRDAYGLFRVRDERAAELRAAYVSVLEGLRRRD